VRCGSCFCVLICVLMSSILRNGVASGTKLSTQKTAELYVCLVIESCLCVHIVKGYKVDHQFWFEYRSVMVDSKLNVNTYSK
jgi:hypothetical protein